MLIRNDREEYIRRSTRISVNYNLSVVNIQPLPSPQDLVNTSHGAHSGAQVLLKLEKYKNC